MADSPAGDRVLLVIPCYNEALRLDIEAFERALSELPWLRLCFVDDGSTDDTARVLEGIASRCPHRVHVRRLAVNAGKAEAVRQGLIYASSRAPVVGFWDADLSAPLSEVAALRAILERAPHVEWVWAIRLRALGRQVVRRPLRHYLGRMFATASSTMLDVAVYDTQCGAKLFRTTALLHTALTEPFQSRWIFDLELLSRAVALLRHAGGPTVEDVVFEQPLASWLHRPGSKVQPADFFRAVRELLLIRRQQPHWGRAMLPCPLVAADDDPSSGASVPPHSGDG